MGERAIGGSSANPPSERIPWRAWDEEPGGKTLTFPAGWSVERLEMAGWRDEETPDLAALRKYVSERASGRTTASIAVEDLTRPARLGEVLETILAGLADAGLAESDVDVVVALGAHGPSAADGLEKKLGNTVSGMPVRLHDAEGDLADSGLTVGKLPLMVDRRFLEADFRIGVGSIIPNPFAGFSGGGKLVLPGLSSLDVLEWLHKLGMMGFAGGPGRTEGNRIRNEVDRIAHALPLHLSVGCLVDSQRRVRELHFGDPVAAHRAGCQRARRVYETPVAGIFNVFVCNAYPKDAEFLQSENGYGPLRTGALRHLASGGSVVLTAACHRGRGHHGLFDEGRPLHGKPTGPKGYLQGFPAYVYAPGISEADCRVTHWEGYPHFQEWDELVASLEQRHGTSARVGIFPAGALQLGPKKKNGA